MLKSIKFINKRYVSYGSYIGFQYVLDNSQVKYQLHNESKISK